ncbi:MAG: hypothetical protein KBC47_04320 [Candidatus Peribacteraceae bacterium]|nr:hypothetical protein [Candidatus Peribacteraceae bacterium]
MRRPVLLFVGLTLLTTTACSRGPAQNPDPNHTHADFAVWIEGKQIEFSTEQFMSGSASDEEHAGALSTYLHLHDGNGHVLHRHKPDLTLTEFFGSLPGIRYHGSDFIFMDCLSCRHSSGKFTVKLYVNGEEEPLGSQYVFKDEDQLLITDASDPTELRKEIRMTSDDACMYSRTCPERGDPPTENCIADPTVPCVQN